MKLANRKTPNSAGPAERQSRAYLEGAVSGRGGEKKKKEMNLANRKTPRIHKKKKNSPFACSEILFPVRAVSEGFGSEVHSLKSSPGLRNH